MTDTRRRMIRLFGLLIALAMLAAACGGAEITDEGTAATTAPPGEEEVAVDPAACNLEAPGEATTINYIGWPFEAMEFYTTELEKCAEIENIDVNVQLLDFTAVTEQVLLALSAGDDSPWDILHATNPEVATWGPDGLLMPLDDLIAKYSDEYDLDDIPQNAWQGAVIDGQTFGVPLVADSQVIAYRSDLFEEFGLAVPTTYDEIIAACGVLADAPGIDVPFVIDFSAGWAMEFEYLAALRSFGGDYLADDNTPIFNGPEGVAALEKMMEVLDACMGDAYLSFGFEAGEAGMNNGTVAFTSIWATSQASFSNPEQSDFSDVIKFAPAAAPKPGSLLGGTAWHNFFVIPATITNDPDLVFRIMMEAADLRSQTDGAGLSVGTRSSVAVGVPNGAAVMETIEKGVGPYEPNPAIVLVQIALGQTLPLVPAGQMTAQEALDAAAEAYIAEATAQGFLP